METRRTRRTAAIVKMETPPPVLPTRELSSRRKRAPRWLTDEDYTSETLPERPAKSSRKLTPPVETVREPTTSKDDALLYVDIKVEDDDFGMPSSLDLSVLSGNSTDIPTDYCRLCLKSPGKDPTSTIVFCTAKSCDYRAHLRCVKDSHPFEFQDKFIPYFKCTDHQCCVACDNGTSPEEQVCVTCTACNRFFHTNCHSPSVATPPENGWKCSGCEPRVSTAASNKTAEDEKVRKKLKTEKRKLRLLKATEKAKAKEATRKVVIPAIRDKPLLRRKEDVTSKNDEQAEKQLKKLKREQKRNMKTLMKSSSREDSCSAEENGVVSDSESRSSDEVEVNPVFLRYLEAKRVMQQEERELRQDLCLWTVDQCASYFVDSFPDLAQLIRKHELYGSSLMLVSGQQLRTLFALPLGKYLIFYDAICKWRKAKF